MHKMTTLGAILTNMGVLLLQCMQTLDAKAGMQKFIRDMSAEKAVPEGAVGHIFTELFLVHIFSNF